MSRKTICPAARPKTEKECVRVVALTDDYHSPAPITIGQQYFRWWVTEIDVYLESCPRVTYRAPEEATGKGRSAEVEPLKQKVGLALI